MISVACNSEEKTNTKSKPAPCYCCLLQQSLVITNYFSRLFSKDKKGRNDIKKASNILFFVEPLVSSYRHFTISAPLYDLYSLVWWNILSTPRSTPASIQWLQWCQYEDKKRVHIWVNHQVAECFRNLSFTSIHFSAPENPTIFQGWCTRWLHKWSD